MDTYAIFGNALTSVWSSSHDNGAPRNIRLADWIRATVEGHPKHLPTLRAIMYTADDEERRRLKAYALPACTPSATWRDRKADTTEPDTLNGWVQFDIDGINDAGKAADLREALRRIPEIAFCGLSASGRNLWGLVKVKHPAKAVQHFQQLRQDFARYGIQIDSVGKPKQLRFYTHDPDAYIADRVTEYAGLPKVKAAKLATYAGTKRDQYAEVLQALKVIEQAGADIAPNHEDYLKLGMGLANEFGEAGREIMHAIARHWHRYGDDPARHHADNDRDYSYFLRYPDKRCNVTTFWKLFHEAGLRIPKAAGSSHTSAKPAPGYVGKQSQAVARPYEHSTLSTTTEPDTLDTPTQAADDHEERAFAELMQFFELCKSEGADMGNNRRITAVPTDLPDEIADLQAFFDTCTFPTEPVMMDGAVIADCDTFARAHISFLRASNRAVYKEPYLIRLRRLKAMIEAAGAPAAGMK